MRVCVKTENRGFLLTLTGKQGSEDFSVFGKLCYIIPHSSVLISTKKVGGSPQKLLFFTPFWKLRLVCPYEVCATKKVDDNLEKMLVENV